MRLKTIVTTLIISLFMAFEAVSPAMSKPVIDRKICFDAGWKFCLGDQSQASSPAYNDGPWRAVTLPHDWSIERVRTKMHRQETMVAIIPQALHGTASHSRCPLR